MSTSARPTRRLHPSSLALLLMGLTSVSGCAGPGELPPDLVPISVVSIRGAGTLPAAGTFGWNPGSRVMLHDSSLDAQQVDQLVREVLLDALVQRGFRPASGPPADVIVGYVLALEDTDHASVSEAFGMDPGLLPAASGQRYDRGTLVVELTLRGAASPVWRGAAQAHADVSNIDEALRRQRLVRAVDQLLGDLSW